MFFRYPLAERQGILSSVQKTLRIPASASLMISMRALYEQWTAFARRPLLRLHDLQTDSTPDLEPHNQSQGQRYGNGRIPTSCQCQFLGQTECLLCRLGKPMNSWTKSKSLFDVAGLRAEYLPWYDETQALAPMRRDPSAHGSVPATRRKLP